jgi:hypothetical protein
MLGNYGPIATSLPFFLMACPAAQDRAYIVFDCRTANGSGQYAIDESCTRTFCDLAS